MRDYARFLGRFNKPTKTLLMEHSACEILLTTEYLRFLTAEYSAVISNVQLVLEMEKTTKLSEFVQSNVDMRREADERHDTVMASTAKGRSNSAYGMALFRSHHSNILFNS